MAVLFAVDELARGFFLTVGIPPGVNADGKISVKLALKLQAAVLMPLAPLSVTFRLALFTGQFNFGDSIPKVDRGFVGLPRAEVLSFVQLFTRGIFFYVWNEASSF